MHSRTVVEPGYRALTESVPWLQTMTNPFGFSVYSDMCEFTGHVRTGCRRGHSGMCALVDLGIAFLAKSHACL
ncbi:unnamed protein product [Protopolystoma xenopodis]|uniref:Uncharacterized protein n=1 Tax=Protopolystoma xenopodis TaxID=117903 RepID=A0A3S5C7J5_9PLAT|nr:unnamed protein product [Protopolystoma xenopodis]